MGGGLGACSPGFRKSMRGVQSWIQEHYEGAERGLAGMEHRAGGEGRTTVLDLGSL